MLPSNVGIYEIQSEIGGNERGRVFRAVDPRTNREVAVKMLRSQSLFTLTGQRKFNEQLARLKSLTHPSLLPIIDFGEEDNRPFIVMALMAGNLTQRMESGPLPAGEVLDWSRNVAAALDFAAANGIVHHDLKPNNVLFDGNSRPYVADLGIFQVIDSLSAANSPRVNPYYASPEQVRRRKLTGQSQQYSLAAILFHALSGQVLFSGATDLVASFKHTSERPRDIHRLRPEMSEAFGEVLKKALAKVPQDRYPSTEAFVMDLVRAQGGALSVEDVQRAAAASPQPARQPPPDQRPVPAPAIRREDLTPALRARRLLALAISLSACVCWAIGALTQFLDSP
ncbi:MAG TPA: serine/threonine-protein kinase [Anaerolineales bacterium]|nr:serine/threonine-protein kinase [Anaerolineales bacterium]